MKQNLFDILQTKMAAPSLLKKKGTFVVDEVLGASLLIASNFLKNKGRYNVITTNLYNAQKVYDLLSSFIGEDNCLFFPMDEMLRTDNIKASKEMLAQRLYVMDELSRRDNYVLICHAASMLRFLPSPRLFKEKTIFFEEGKNYNLEQLKELLIKNGYTRVTKIDSSMQFALRGDILDIYSVNNANPIRLEFFDDELESIRYFDIATQRSIKRIQNISILPSYDIILTEEEKNTFENKLLNRLEEDTKIIGEVLGHSLEEIVKRHIEHIKDNVLDESIYKYYGYIQETHFSILDYSSNSINIICNKEGLENTSRILEEEATDYFYAQFEKGFSLSHLGMYQNYYNTINEHRCVYCHPLAHSENDIVFNVRNILGGTNSINGAYPLISSYQETSKKLLLCLTSEQQRNSIEYLLREHDIEFERTEGLQIPTKQIGVSIFSLENGFELVEDGIVVLTAKELLGFRNKTSRFMNRYKSAVILKSYQDLTPGDYVVHEQYGIGRFLDVQTLENNGVHRDYLHIQYAGSDVLYVPVEQFKLVRKFVGKEGAAPKINKLNSNEWEKTKKKIKERVNEIADRLLALYSERSKATGFAFKEDDEFQETFENQFPFELTEGQQEALKEIKDDMEKPIPMDRLLCGDVGFGKTELAFRAAFKAINSGKQVALLCPTTLLARQHYERAIERFTNFGIKIAIFSRLVSESTQKKYMKGLEDGSIHLAIGTHRLLSKEINFKDLGLLIVDEEQRFGVEQKERIKELKTSVDVLTLTATPIPRTLQMSLVGIRNLSQLNTAPMNRMPIQTYVMPQKDDVIKELLERELARKGQVFYVHNVVDTIYSKATKIQSFVKDARVAVVHGQMERDQIEDTMIKFYNGEIDVLVCTSIIETGIDVANANMIIIENADCFGLSQLYQIKGRVGRGNRIAYAYLLYKERKQLNEDAAKRLKAIQEFTELGSGYKIAQRDLMIRGAGDMLGPEQAGFIDSVGIDMYIELLNEAITEKQNPNQSNKLMERKPNKLINIDAYIPSEYASKGEKINLYKEIDGVNDFDGLKDVEDKIKDIYGTIPEEVNRLFIKKTIDLYQQEYWFKDFVEYNDHIDLICSKEFSNIDGIGFTLFKELQKYLLILKVNIQNKELKLSIKKRDYWLKDYQDISSIIYKLAMKYKESEEL